MYAEQWHRIDGRKTDRWGIASKRGDRLGVVSWFTRWRQYTFNPSAGTTFNAGCLKNMAEFLKSVNDSNRKFKSKKT